MKSFLNRKTVVFHGVGNNGLCRVFLCFSASVRIVDRPPANQVNVNYVGYRAPLRPLSFIKGCLVGSI